MAMNSVVRSTAGASRQIDRLLCGLRGHFMLLRFAPHKLSLHCALCGHESAGWEIGEQSLPRMAEREDGTSVALHRFARPPIRAFFPSLLSRHSRSAIKTGGALCRTPPLASR
jgi:hypothetical protein